MFAVFEVVKVAKVFYAFESLTPNDIIRSSIKLNNITVYRLYPKIISVKWISLNFNEHNTRCLSLYMFGASVAVVIVSNI